MDKRATQILPSCRKAYQLDPPPGAYVSIDESDPLARGRQTACLAIRFFCIPVLLHALKNSFGVSEDEQLSVEWVVDRKTLLWASLDFCAAGDLI